MNNIYLFSAAIFAAFPLTSIAQEINYADLGKAVLLSPLKTISPTGFGTWKNGIPSNKNNKWMPAAAIAYGALDIYGIAPSEKCNGKFPVHLGVDYSGAGESAKGKGDGTPVYAVATGKVIHSNGFTSAGDWHVIIQSGSSKDPWTALYGHLSTNVKVKKGDTVQAGQQIGSLFNYKDYSDKPHLHFGIRKGAYKSSTSSQGFICPKANGTFDNLDFRGPELLYYSTSYIY